MLGIVFFVLSILAAFFDWYVILKKDPELRNWSKPAPIILLLITVWILVGGEVRFPLGIFMSGLFFGLLGDIFLQLKSERWFLFGLGAFLIGHLLYILGLNVATFEGNSITSFLLLLPIAALMVVFLNTILPEVEKSLKIPVAAYCIVILTMFYSGLLTLISSTWSMTASILAAVGAGFFVFSDMMLAWNKFVSPKEGIWIMVTYHLAQFAIIGAALVQFA